MTADDPVMRALGGAFLNHPGLKPTTVDEPYTPDDDVVQDRYVGGIHSLRREAEFARWLNRVKAEVWLEGNMAGRYEITDPADVPNPYEDEA